MKPALTLILLLFFTTGCSPIQNTSPQPSATSKPVISSENSTPENIPPTFTPTSPPPGEPTKETIQPAPAGIVYLTDEGHFITMADGPPELLYQPEEKGVWSSLSPNQVYYLEFGTFDQAIFNLQEHSRVQIWPREGLNLCPFSWAAGQPAVLISVLLPEGADPGYSCNRGSPVLLFAATQELILLDDTTSGLSGPAVSPDGQVIAYDVGGVPWLYRFDEAASRLDLSQFDVDSLQTAQFADPAWSQSSTVLAWTFRIPADTSLQGIAVFDFSRNSALLFSPYEVGPHENFRPRLYFSPSEKNLVLDQYLADQGDFASQVIALDGGFSRQLDGYFNSWSPANDWLVYEKKPGQGACRLSVESSDGSTSIPVCRGDQARWSPDGSQILTYPYDRDQFWLTDLQTQLSVKIDLPAGAQILRWESGE